MPEGSASTAAGGLDTTTTRDSFIPIFSGLPADYREWRKRITIYHAKMVISKRPSESILNIIGSMQGVAWKLVEDFPLDKLEDAKTFNALLDILDKSFQYDARVQLPADFDFYFGLQRKPGQSLLEHCTAHDDAVRRLSNHDITLSKAVQGWHLLRSANLTKEQKELVTLRAPNMEKEKVQEAMFLILGQDHKSAVSRDDKKWHRGGHRTGRGYAAFYEDDNDDWEEIEGEDAYWGDGWADYESPGDYEQEYAVEFDQDAVYYQEDEIDGPQDYDVEAYDTAYAAYQDARKRFTDLKPARGYLPVVALADPAAGNVSPGVSQAPYSPSRSGGFKGGGKKGKGGGRKGKGKGKATFRYTPAPPKQADPRGRAAAAICLRCGQVRHTTATCPVQAKQGVKRSSPTESMAKTDEAMVIFVDIFGQERVDCAMMDPGASAFLCGYGPFKRYIEYLIELGFPQHLLEFHRVRRKFYFGGDGESWCNWSVRLPMFLKGQFGKVQVFLLKGETPMLCGRPIIEALGIDIGFAKKRYRFDEGHWQDALLGVHGEYLLPLTDDYDARLLQSPPSFDLRVDAEDETENTTFGIDKFDAEENVFFEAEAAKPPPYSSWRSTPWSATTWPQLPPHYGVDAQWTWAELSGLCHSQPSWTQAEGSLGSLHGQGESGSTCWSIRNGSRGVWPRNMVGTSTRLRIELLSWRDWSRNTRMRSSSRPHVVHGLSWRTWMPGPKSSVRILQSTEIGTIGYIFALCERPTSRKSNKEDTLTLNNPPMRCLGKPTHSGTCPDWRRFLISVAMDVCAQMTTGSSCRWGSQQCSLPARSWCMTPWVFVVMEAMTTVPWKAQDLELDVAPVTWRTTSPLSLPSLPAPSWWMNPRRHGSLQELSMRRGWLADLWWSSWRRIVRRRCARCRDCIATWAIQAIESWWSWSSLEEPQKKFSRWLGNFTVWPALGTRSRIDWLRSPSRR